jgi:F-type H+-transporting ATPase subunit b
MEIDWFTLIAQVINFLIILVLLKYFLYDRILNAMDKREQKIADRLQEAEDTMRQAEEEKKSFMEKSQQLEKQADERLIEAREKAETERKELVKQARDEVEKQEKIWRESLKQQREDVLQNLRRKVGRHVFDVSRKILHELADDDLEKRLIQGFLHRLSNLDQSERETLFKQIKNTDEPAIVRSVFEISDSSKQKIEKTLADFTEGEFEVQFKSSEDLICGIEIHANGQKLGWSIDAYLRDLEEDIALALQEASAETDSPPIAKQNQAALNADQ